METENATLILASQSPRRRYLLEQAGVDITVVPSAFDEASVAPTDPAGYVRLLAREKANDVAERYPQHWVIGADTIVTIDGAILGKPVDAAAARDMLQRLSGHEHYVYTGYAIVCKSKMACYEETVKTSVQFKDLSDAEIDWYVQTGEPFDKAGAYAIQGIGTFLIKRINGSYTNVVGLPVCEVITTLLAIGVLKLNTQETKGADG